MDHTTPDIDTDALLAEVNALLATDARIDALLAQPVVVTSFSGRLAALRATAAEHAAALDAIELDQAEIERQIEALERDA